MLAFSIGMLAKDTFADVLINRITVCSVELNVDWAECNYASKSDCFIEYTSFRLDSEAQAPHACTK